MSGYDSKPTEVHNTEQKGKNQWVGVIIASVIAAAAVAIVVLLRKQDHGEDNSTGSNSHLYVVPAGSVIMTLGLGSVITNQDLPAIDSWMFSGDGGWGNLLADLRTATVNKKQFQLWNVDMSKVASADRTRYTFVPGDPMQLTYEIEGVNKTFNVYSNDRVDYNRPLFRMIPVRVRVTSARIYYRPDWVPSSRRDWRQNKGRAQGVAGIISTWEWRVGNSRDGCPFPGGTIPFGWDSNALIFTATRCDFPLQINSSAYKWTKRCKDIEKKCLEYLMGLVTTNAPAIWSQSSNGFEANNDPANWINARPDSAYQAKYRDFSAAWDSILLGRPLHAIFDPVVACPVDKDLTFSGSSVLPPNNTATSEFNDDDTEPDDSTPDDEVAGGYVGPASNLTVDDYNRLYSWFYGLRSPGATWFVQGSALLNRALDRAYWSTYLNRAQVINTVIDDKAGRVAQIFRAGGCRMTKDHRILDCTLWYCVSDKKEVRLSDPWRWPDTYGNQFDDGFIIPPILTGSINHGEAAAAVREANGDVQYINDHYWVLPPALDPCLRPNSE